MTASSHHHHHHHPHHANGSSRGLKYLIVGLVVGLVVGMQIMLVQVNSAAPAEEPSSTRATALYQEPPRGLQQEEKKEVVQPCKLPKEAVPSSLAAFPLSDLPEGALQKDLRSADASWPKPLSKEETAHWLDVLDEYTQSAVRKGPSESVRQRKGVENPLGFLPAAEEPVSIKTWVEQGKCKHADLYLAHILDRLRPWSNGGIAKSMIEEAARKGRERSGFAGLHYQIIDGNVYGRAEGNSLYIERYAGLFANTLRHLKLPNIELALHNGLDLPVMLKHEVHPMFAYASGDTHSEMLVPCTWYVLPLAASLAKEAEEGEWEPVSLADFKERAGKIFWRGSPNDYLHYTKDNFRFAPRVKLVAESLKRPELLDAQLTSSLVLLGGTGWETECAVYDYLGLGTPEEAEGKACSAETVAQYRKAQEAKSAPLNNHGTGYRYALNMDGTGVSERLSQQLSSAQLIFRVDSPFYNYYSRFFLPYVHYIPVKYDLSDLVEKIEWANAHVEEAHAIMTRAAKLAREVFHPDEVTCYTGLALAAYGRLMGFEPELREDMALFE